MSAEFSPKATPLPKAKALLMDAGAHATNFFIHTPVCCPSRSETVTGRYLHNVKTNVEQAVQCGEGYAGEDKWGNVCCMHVDEGMVNNRTLAQYLQRQAGYRVGMFGKYLNNCPTEMPPGFSAWYANGGSTVRRCHGT
jgi:arylsulfatase A-like enzyme